MILDWTKQEQPWIDNGRIYYNFVTPFNSDVVTLQGSYDQSYTDGIREILDYYYKEQPESVADKILKEQPFLIEPRSGKCSLIHYLVSVDKAWLDSLPDRVVIASGGTLVTKSWQDLEEMFSISKNVLGKMGTFLKSNYLGLFRDSFELPYSSFPTVIDNLKASLSALALNNQITIQSGTNISFLFRDDTFIAAIEIDGKIPKIGVLDYIQRVEFRNIFINSMIINSEFVENFYYENVNLDKRYDWDSFVLGIKGNYNFLIDESKLLSASLTETAKEAVLNGPVSDVLKSYADTAKRDWERLIKPDFSIGAECGTLGIDDIPRIVKTFKEKQIEDSIVTHSKSSVSFGDLITYNFKPLELTQGRDFVGDKILSEFVEGGYPKNIDEIYTNILNYVNIETLMKKVVECLGVGVPDICLDVYVPWTFNFPDTFDIGGLFDKISDLILQAILFLIQEILMTLMREIFVTLQECEFEDFKRLFSNDSEGALVDGVSDTKFMEAVFDKLKGVESPDSLLGFIEEVYKTLLPTEFCALINGNPTQKAMRIVMCILESRFQDLYQDVLTDEDKVKSFFIMFKNYFNSNVCLIPANDSVPPGKDGCESPELRLVRESFENNITSLTPQQIDKQIDLMQSLKAQKSQAFLGMLFERDTDNMLTNGEEFGKFLTDQLPCAKDNQEMSHMSKITVNAVFDGLSRFYVDAIAGSFSYSPYFSEETGKQDFLDSFSVKRQGGALRIGNFLYTTPQDETQTRLNLGNGMVLTSNPIHIPKSINTTGNIREKYFRDFVFEKKYTILFSDTPLGLLTIPTPPPVNDYVIGSDFPDMFSYLEEVMSKKVLEIFKTSNSFSVPASQAKSRIQQLVAPRISPAFENCWNGNAPNRESLLEAFYDDECLTRDVSSFNEAMKAGLVFQYARTVALRAVINTFPAVTDVGFEGFKSGFMLDYLTRMMLPIVDYASQNKHVSNIDSVMQNNVDNILTIMSAAFNGSDDAFRSNNILLKILESLPVHTYDTPLPSSDEGFFWTYERIGAGMNVSLNIQPPYSGLGLQPGIQVVTVFSPSPLISDAFPLFVEEEKVKDMFLFCFPIYDYLGAVMAHTLFNMKLNSTSYTQILDSIESSLLEIDNVNNFTFANEDAANREGSKLSQSRKQDPRSENVRFLSLPWIFDILI